MSDLLLARLYPFFGNAQTDPIVLDSLCLDFV